MSNTGVYNHNSSHTNLGFYVIHTSSHEGLYMLTSWGRLGGFILPPWLTSPVVAVLIHPQCGIYRCRSPYLLTLVIAVATVAMDTGFFSIVC